MSKISKNIKMLDILSSGKRYSCTELANMLEVSPRMIRSYKDELEKEGIYIEAYYGKDGGYQLKQSIDMPDILFNDEDLNLLDNLIKESKDYRNQLCNLKDKIEKFSRLLDDDLSFLSDEKQEMLDNIKTAIRDKRCINIEYFSKGEVKTRIVRPLQIYIYDELIMIVVNYSEDVRDIRHLNLNRINKIVK